MLTRKQQQVWEAIQQWYYQHGYAPTLDEIAQTVGINTRSTIHQHIQGLIKEGLVLEGEGKRAYTLPNGMQKLSLDLSLPLEGRIAAGKPIQAIEDTNDISPSELFAGPGRYVLEVRGDSMIDIGVMDGDYVVIQRNNHANNGDIVVALIDREEATLKRIFYKDDSRVELRPENKTIPTMIYPAESVQIQGKMVGLFRNCK